MRTSNKRCTALTAALFAVGIAPIAAEAVVEFEPNHPTQQAQYVISSTGSVEIDGALAMWNADKDADFFKFYATAGDVISLDVDLGYGVGVSVDTVMAIFQENGGTYELLRFNDDSPPDPGSNFMQDSAIVDFRVPATGMYVVGVSSFPRVFNPDGTVVDAMYFDDGDYQLIITGIAPSMQQTNIDIKPGHDKIAKIKPNSKKKIPVAILSSPEFNAMTVNVDSLRFGPTGNEQPSLYKCKRRGKDVNKDGRLDLVCKFYSEKANFEPGDNEGCVKGTYGNGTAFEGCGWLKVKAEKKKKVKKVKHKKEKKEKKEKKDKDDDENIES